MTFKTKDPTAMTHRHTTPPHSPTSKQPATPALPKPSTGLRVGIIGGGWPALQHAKAIADLPGVTVTAIADLLEPRRQEMLKLAPKAKDYTDALHLCADPAVDLVVIATPTDTHDDFARKAIQKSKAILIEPPGSTSHTSLKRLAKSAHDRNLPAFVSLQRRAGAAEQAARAAVLSGAIGEVYHARATWLRARAIPVGTGWYGQTARSGGGALLDLGYPMLDLALCLMGNHEVTSAMAATHRRFADVPPPELSYDAEDAATALLTLSNAASLELAVSWAINQPPSSSGTSLRLHGTQGCIDVYTPDGPLLYRHFNSRGDAERVKLKLPKLFGYPAIWRSLKAIMIQHKTQAPQADAPAPAHTSDVLVSLSEAAHSQAVIDRLYRTAAKKG